MSVHKRQFALERLRPQTYPAKVFGYLGLCNEIKKQIKSGNIAEANLPLVSPITMKYTPEGVVHAHWSFLKY